MPGYPNKTPNTVLKWAKLNQLTHNCGYLCGF